MQTILKYLQPFYKRMIWGFVIKTAGTVFELLLPVILSYILKTVVLQEEIGQILFWGGMMLLCSAGACLCNIIANRMAARVSRNFAEQIRKDLFAQILQLSAAQTDFFTIPSLESRITTDTYNVHNFVNMMQRMGVRAPIMLIGGIVITLLMDQFLALAMIALLPVIFAIVFFISRKGVPLYTRVQRSVDNMIRVVREDTQGMRVIKALSKAEYERDRYDKVNHTLVQDETKAGIIMGSVNPVMTLLMNVGIVAVVTISAARIANGLSSPETVIAFIQYFTLISMALMSVTRIFTMYTKSAASAKRIAEVLNTEEEITVQDKEEYPDIHTQAHIVFRDVNFSYKGKKNNLENISFELPKGGSLGIIGATGSGKSTLIRLLLRLYDVNSGSIYVNGQDIRTIDPGELYHRFGTVLQQDFLYADTIEENIRFGREIAHEDVVRAAQIAQAHDFITAFPDGYQHRLSQKGTNISGGQKQRILIARAVAGKPDILLLDDSSSALDYKTDALLRNALKQEMKGTTVVTVAQRVSSVMNCGLILVLDEGRIVGMGTHEHLLETCSEYREISQSQIGGAFLD